MSDATMDNAKPKPKRPAKIRTDAIKDFRCKNLIAVIENPDEYRNIRTVIRNVNVLGVEKHCKHEPHWPTCHSG